MHICISLTHNQSKSEEQSWNNKEIMAEEGGVQGTVDGDTVLDAVGEREEFESRALRQVSSELLAELTWPAMMMDA